MVTKVTPISTPPTPSDPPAVFEERAAQVWADLHLAVPQMNQQAQDIDEIGLAAEDAKKSASSDASAANKQAANADVSAKAAAKSAAESLASSKAATTQAESADASAKAAAQSASNIANLVPMTSPTGSALLPQGTDAQRPAKGTVPDAWLQIRGNTKDPNAYVVEYFDQSGGRGWQSLAPKFWVSEQLSASEVGTDNKIATALNEIGFAMIYPAGGSEANPATVSANSVYVMDNPFPGSHVIVLAEINAGYGWGATGWYSAVNGGYGTQASATTDDKILVQCGNLGVAAAGNVSGGIIDKTYASAKCRVKVWKVRGKR
ncbi:MAG: hypothetical protein LBJ15_19730 [Comamonas sp.]|jgi:hypothetical protein|uniref:hypothetical protein n=1 Tax=Comamonas sp. TaxID=34028 RepID=UPI002830E09A|nr:hypothetical protein [Comamonas sp.]MDR0216207.1 hypothetical protein [Comamonas sp.]